MPCHEFDEISGRLQTGGMPEDDLKIQLGFAIARGLFGRGNGVHGRQ
jgi:hypothetical protein